MSVGLVTSQRQGNGKLIVNYVPQQMTEEELKSIFSAIGPIESCKLVIDRQTQASLGYGFIVYQDPAQADQAVAALNGLKVENKRLKVSFARPSGTDIKNTNLYVAGLPPSVVDDESLVTLFHPFGNVIQARLLTDGNGLPRNVGFVRYDERRDAEAAMVALNGQVPEGGTLQLTIRYAESPRTKAQQQDKQPGAYLASMFAAQQQAGLMAPPVGMQPYGQPSFAGALPGMFQGGLPGTQPGAVAPGIAAPATAMPTPGPQQLPIAGVQTGYPSPGYPSPATNPAMHGMGHTAPPMNPAVEQQNMGSYAAAGMNRLHQHRFNPMAGNSLSQGFSIFVYNIPGNAQDIQLYQLFSPYGAISNVKVATDQNGAGKGYAFVNMVKYEEAWQAIAALNGHEVEGKTLQVSFKTTRASKLK